MLEVHGCAIAVLYSAGDPEDNFVHVVKRTRFNGEATYFEIHCDPGAWRREHRAIEAEVPTCLFCAGATFR